ncbi:MAG: transcriptional repressor [Deltaproteobacteria bacterium]|nr:transcriptional repressor [Deltaproteobacteria bacterium]
MTKEAIIERLKEKGLNITSPRLAIIDVLVEDGHFHPGASHIYREAKKRHRSLSLSTTYATIHEFIRHGIIKALEFDGKENRFEGNLDEHINLICERCGKIIDYKAPISVDRLDVAKTTGFVITSNRWEYYGYCRDCIKNLNSATPTGELRKRHS